jgi:hypothetical protein
MIDACESAVTDGLTKAASMVDVGEAVFRGLLGLDAPIDCEQDSTTYNPEKRLEQAEAALCP